MDALERVIYLDILLSVNLFVNYFMLLAVAKFLYLKPKRLRIILGAMVGSIYSMYIFVPTQCLLISTLVRLVMMITIIIVSFGIKKTIFLKSILCFCLINFSFLGLIILMWISLKPHGVSLNNGIVYFNISPLSLIIFTSISYFILEFINRFLGKHICKDDFCHVIVKINDKSTEFDAFVDTGNMLKEPFSNLPVIIAKKEDIYNIVPDNFNIDDGKLLYYSPKDINKKFRLIPFEGVSHEGFILAFKPDVVTIKTSSGKSFEKDAYVAICSDKNFEQSLVGPEILDN